MNYQYDSLNRLINAYTTGPEWGQSYTYDGFGNMSAQTVTKGSAPAWALTVDAANNRIANWVYDANGNVTNDGSRAYGYDVENRLVSSSGMADIRYDSANQRVFDGVNYTFWSPDGQRILKYQLSLAALPQEMQLYFGGKLIGTMLVVSLNSAVIFEAVATDRLGSVRARGGQSMRYFPYGQEMTSTAAGQDKFGTYLRDASTGLDYANQRYYGSVTGRFITADPSMPGNSANPASWNMYAYVGGDPVNANDRQGLLTIIIGGTVLNPFGGSDAAWGQPGTPFNVSVSRFFGEQAVVYEWSGQLFDRIFSGALGLRDFINGHTFKPGEKLNIVAHSHGGNVVKAYTGMDSRFIDTLITMGTPQRSDFPIFRNRVGTYLNVYSKHDWVQKSGGPWYFFGLPFAGRTDPLAINIGVDRAYGIGDVGHGDLHTPQVWCEMEQWLLRAGYHFGVANSGPCGTGAGGYPPRPRRQAR